MFSFLFVSTPWLIHSIYSFCWKCVCFLHHAPPLPSLFVFSGAGRLQNQGGSIDPGGGAVWQWLHASRYGTFHCWGFQQRKLHFFYPAAHKLGNPFHHWLIESWMLWRIRVSFSTVLCNTTPLASFHFSSIQCSNGIQSRWNTAGIELFFHCSEYFVCVCVCVVSTMTVLIRTIADLIHTYVQMTLHELAKWLVVAMATVCLCKSGLFLNSELCPCQSPHHTHNCMSQRVSLHTPMTEPLPATHSWSLTPHITNAAVKLPLTPTAFGVILTFEPVSFLAQRHGH